MKAKKLIIILSVVVILLVVCAFSLLFFFHTTVTVDSDFGVDSVTVTEEISGDTVTKNSTKFSHSSQYGRYKYEFVSGNQNYEVDVFKTDAYKHSDVKIIIRSIDSGVGMHLISVEVDGVRKASGEHKLGEADCISLSVGP